MILGFAVLGKGLAPRDRLERALQLGRVGRHQLLDLGQQVRERLQCLLVALPQLQLELREPLDHRVALDDLNPVDRDLDHGPIPPVEALPALLPDAYKLAERARAHDGEHRVAGSRRRPVGDAGLQVGRTLQFLAPAGRRPAVVAAAESLSVITVPSPLLRRRRALTRGRMASARRPIG